MAAKVTGCKAVKPLLSANYCEAHTRVVGLYKAYYRYIPYLVRQFDIPKSPEDCRWKLRENFYKHACVTDLRVIDMLVIKVNRDGVGCWNSNKPYTPDTNPLIISDPELFEFPNDLKVDYEDTLWILSDKLPRFIYKGLDPNAVNHRIFSIKVVDAITGTACQ
ncbi:L-dopachrome tautomerase yellow-f2-like isoform X1 [Pieris rapae]|uniref:L-dopachrome tautomerase yellow-f2-like isoform X1 n=1 Tax=Pieris rapae TaxID=64459 RepID=UPI001E27AEF7|nr:L-dopachrome tautomerase yellow-f2-like isoform X1 [Pieris rapae]